MQRKANESFSHEKIDADLTEEDFQAMEANLSAMEDHLFNAGVAILQAAKTQEEIFHTSIEAIQEALEPGSSDAATLISSLPEQPSSHAAHHISLTAIWERLNTIEQRLEYLIDQLVPIPATTEITKPEITKNLEQKALGTSEWTEKSLKKAYKTLAGVRTELGIEAKSWKSAVHEANTLKML
jgi:hypothetical protein